MKLQIKVPTVGESITEVTIAQWLKKEGDLVQLDEIIAELESDKATFELPAEGSGVLHIIAEEGDTVEIGAVLCEINTDGATSDKPSSKAADATPTATAVVESAGADPKATGEIHDMVVPVVGESITEVTLGTWLKKDGDFVKLDEEIAEIESDKATFELAAEKQGILKIVVKEGETMEIGALICKIEVMEGEVAQASSPAAAQADAPTPQGGSNYATGHPSPAAGKILDEKGINPLDIKGTGVGGRITKEDAANAQKAAPKSEASATSVQTVGSRGQTRSKMSSLRKTIARRLVAVKNETAMLTTFNEVDMKPIMDIRSKYKESFKEKHGVGLGFMSFFTKACCEALQEFPSVNGYIDGNEIIHNDYCDISIAVSSPRGLVVPVIRNAESLGFKEIESEVVRLAVKARDGKLSIDEMTGGTFTLTNGGIFGSMMSTPIINAPQSAILGMHNIVQRAVVVNGEIVIRPMMYLALSYDHRIIDGKESVGFLVRVKQLLEDPTRLMLGV